MPKFIFTGVDPNNEETWKNGGGRAMLYLFSLLQYIGVEASFDGPAADIDFVIYPDCVRGNPLNAKKVIHWMLYFWSGERIPASECVIVYHEAYFDQVAQRYDRELPVENIVELPTIEPGLFYPEEKTIESICYPGKMNVTELPESEFGTPIPLIGKGTMSRTDFAATLRKTKRLYSLDHHTIVFTEAALCGCRSWRVHGKGMDEVIIEHPNQFVMDPHRDAALARKFVQIATDFFK